MWRAGLGEDQRFFLVAGHRGVLEDHLQPPGGPRHALGEMVWGRKVFGGEGRGRGGGLVEKRVSGLAVSSD